MSSITFETGITTFTVNGTCDISFNPTDSGFVERLFDVFYDLDRRQEGYQAEVAKMTDGRAIFEYARRRDAEMRELIDSAFGPVSDTLFGTMNVYAMADGLPVWCNLMLAVMDEVDTAFAREQKAMDPRIQKYTSKYHR